MRAKFFFIFIPVIFISFVSKAMHGDLNDYKTYKEIADSIFHTEQDENGFSFQDVYHAANLDAPRVAVMIGNLFNSTDKNALVIYSTADNTLSLNLFRKQNSKWIRVQQESISYGSTGPSDQFIYFNDLNNDGTKDLMILTEVMMIRTVETYKAFLFEKNILIGIKGFEDFPNPQYDEETKRVYAYAGIACADMTMMFETGAIVGDSLATETTITCDCCIDDGDSCSISIDHKKTFNVKNTESYKYVQPHYRDFLKEKMDKVNQYDH